MKRTNSAAKKGWARLKERLPLLVPILIFAVTAVILIAGIRGAGEKRTEEEMRIAKDSVLRAAVSCYAIEGAYPDTFAYLRDNYSVAIDEDKYFVDYSVFASNIMPEVTAMTAAETGHLVLSTLHTVGAANTIDRIIDVFPPARQQQVRVQISMILQSVVSRQLVPMENGDLIPAFEIMHLNSAIRNMIRDSKIHQIDSVIATSGADGMITMDGSLLELVKNGRISKQTAIRYATNPDIITKKLAAF